MRRGQLMRISKYFVHYALQRPYFVLKIVKAIHAGYKGMVEVISPLFCLCLKPLHIYA